MFFDSCSFCGVPLPDICIHIYIYIHIEREREREREIGR